MRLAQLCLLVGGLCTLALVAAIALALLGGEDRFPAPLAGRDTGLGTYVWQIGALILGAFVVWRLMVALVARLNPLDAWDASDADDNWVGQDSWLPPEAPPKREP
jgi:hypothetical protein